MKNILYLLLFVSSVFAYDPTQFHNEQALMSPYLYSDDAGSVQLRESVNSYSEDTEEYKSEAQTAAQKEAIVAQKTDNQAVLTAHKSPYFLSNFEYEDTGLYCPPLSSQHQNTHSVLIEKIDFNSGSVTCSVFEIPHSTSAMSEDLKKVTPFQNLVKVYTQNFQNPKYLDLMKSRTQNADSLLSSDALAAAELFNEQMALAKQTVQQRYTNMGQNQAQKFLNLSEIIDAVMVFDEDIIDIQASLDQNDLVLKAPYVQSYKAAHIREEVENNNKLIYEVTKELNSMWSVLPVFFDPKSETSMEQKKSDAAQILGNHLNSLLYFIVKYFDIFNWTIIVFLSSAILFALYNVSHYFFERAGNENENKNLKFKIGMTSVTALFILLTTWTSPVYRSDSGYTVELSSLQNLVSFLSEQTNAIANDLTKAVFDSYIGGMFNTSSVMSKSQAQILAKDKLKAEFVRDYQANHLPRCFEIFDQNVLKSFNPENYSKNPDFDFLSDTQVKTSNNVSPYNTVSNGGYVKTSNWAITPNDTLKYSLNACNQIESDHKSNLAKLNVYGRKIDNFNNIEMQQKNYEAKSAIINKLFLDLQQYGYIAAPMLAIVGTYEKIYELPHKKAEEYLDLFSDFQPQKWLGFGAENIFFQFAFGGGMQEYAQRISSIATDAAVGWIPFVGTGLSNIASNSAGLVVSLLFVDSMVELIPALRNLFIFGLGTVMLMLMFIAKFAVFWLLPFAVIYAFLSQSAEKISKQIVKVLITFFKPVIFIFVLFLTLFVIEFFHNFIFQMLDEMTNLLAGDDGFFQYLISHIIKNVAHIFAIIIEFVVTYQLAVNGTKTIVGFFELQSNDLADVISDGVAQTIQNKVIK